MVKLIDMYTLKVKKISVENESGDTTVIVTCYLLDGNNISFKNSNGELDTFTIRAPKSSLPLSGYLTYLTGLATAQIAYKYNKTLSAVGVDGSDTLTLSEADIKSVFIDMKVSGPGISTTLDVESITSVSNIKLSGDLTLEHTGNTTAPTFTHTGDTTISSNTITNMSATTNIVEGMVVSGLGIPSGAVVISILSSTSIVISQNALATNAGITLTFSTNANSQYVTSLNPAIFTTKYEGLTITGTNIARNTTVLETISTSSIKLSQNATGGATGATYVISGTPTYYFDTAGWTVTYSGLQKVVDIIDFSNL